MSYPSLTSRVIALIGLLAGISGFILDTLDNFRGVQFERPHTAFDRLENTPYIAVRGFFGPPCDDI